MSKENYLNCFNWSNNKFRITGTALKDFYNTMFNINIKELYKKKPMQMPIITTKEVYSLTTTENDEYTNKVLNFRIIIEDNNKKIFKHKVLKAKFKVNYATIDEYYKNVYADIWGEIDKVVFDYCKKYLYKKNTIEYMQFVNKYYDFQYTYQQKENNKYLNNKIF